MHVQVILPAWNDLPKLAHCTPGPIFNAGARQNQEILHCRLIPTPSLDP